MVVEVSEKDLNKLAEEMMAKLGTPGDVEAFTKALRKQFWEATLEGEMDEHLGYSKHKPADKGTGNSRNGKAKKRLKSELGELEIQTPRDRNGTFEPKAIEKRQSRVSGIDEKILFLYAKGQSTRDIADTIHELYDIEISSSLISRVTDRVTDQMKQWQTEPLMPLYPIVYLDCIVLKIRHNQKVINKSMYLALGVNLEGHKELLGMWLAETEGAKFWLSVLTDHL